MNERHIAQPQKTARTLMPMRLGLLQRACACGQHRPGGECAECRKKRLATAPPGLQRAPLSRSGGGAGNEGVPPIVHEVLRSPGQPLDAATRAFMEPRFGHDFSHVRVHTGEQASQSAQAVNALAYTVGREVVFGAGQYVPGSAAGKRLLAHELTHVAQQSSRALAAQPIPVGEADHSCERQAEAVAGAISIGDIPHKDLQPGQQSLQRMVDPARVSCDRFPRTYPIFTAIGTDDPVGILQAADARAIEMLDNVIAELSHIRAQVAAGEPPAWPLIGDALAISLRQRLRLNPADPNVWTGTGPGTIEIIIRWFTNVRSTLISGRVNYTCLDPDCGADDWASAIPGNMRIFLCRLFWRDTHDPVNGRALTLIHEAAHVYYGLEDTGGGPGSAHCLEQFMSDANGIAIHPDFEGDCRAPRP